MEQVGSEKEGTRPRKETKVAIVNWCKLAAVACTCINRLRSKVMDTLARAHIRKGEAKEGSRLSPSCSETSLVHVAGAGLRVAEDFLAAAKKAGGSSLVFLALLARRSRD